ncbi:hypothetical protein BU16DRAFT_568393 [Lophium mytilinum]|uniref:CCHC-type domain-containing protein n=1 Tax=Lophium mytilinum TaxID=390894 RepID=A0A6A6Q7U3_9PEZI|nr:hypothetical protein BU16DRAFT_568393 [Lophium mytilinum]
MDAEGDGISPEDSRTASLGRKRTRQSFDDEQALNGGQGTQVSASKHNVTKRVRTDYGGLRIASDSRIDTGLSMELLSVPDEAFEQDGYAGLPHDSETQLAELGQQSKTTNGTPTAKHVHQSRAFSAASSDVAMENTDEPDTVELISSNVVLPTALETIAPGTNDTSAYEQTPGQETGTVPGYSVTDADRSAIERRETKRTYNSLHLDNSKELATGIKVNVSFDLPDVAVHPMEKPQEAPRSAFEHHIARHALRGLKAIYYPVGDQQQDHTGEDRFQALLCYAWHKSTAAIESLQDHPLTVWGEAKPVTVSVLDFVSEDWAIADDFSNTFIKARIDAIIDRLHTGDLRREDYGPLRHFAPRIQKQAKCERRREKRHQAKRHIDANQEVQSITDSLAIPKDAASETDAALVDRSTEPVYWFQDPADAVPRCQMCMQQGHSDEECPSRTCRHCHAHNEHFSNACPTRKRCAKCHQAGHAEDECYSSFSVRVIPCDLCQRQGHAEEQCSLLWRTFFPENVRDLKKVGQLIRSCYYCGGVNHWGDDCPLNQASSVMLSNAGSTTFSSREAAYFLRGLEQAEDNGIAIRGRASTARDDIKDENENISRHADPGNLQQAYQNRFTGAVAANVKKKPRMPRLGRLDDLIFHPGNESIKEEDAHGINSLRLNIQPTNGRTSNENANGPATNPHGLSNRSNGDSLEAQRAYRLAMMSPEQHANVPDVQNAQKRKGKSSKNANLLPLGNANRLGDPNAQQLNGNSNDVGVNEAGLGLDTNGNANRLGGPNAQQLNGNSNGVGVNEAGLGLDTNEEKGPLPPKKNRKKIKNKDKWTMAGQLLNAEGHPITAEGEGRRKGKEKNKSKKKGKEAGLAAASALVERAARVRSLTNLKSGIQTRAMAQR